MPTRTHFAYVFALAFVLGWIGPGAARLATIPIARAEEPADARLPEPETRPSPSSSRPAYPPWKVGLSIETVSTGLTLKPGQDEARELEYRPSESNYAGLIVGYRWLATTIAFAIPANRETRDREGESDYRDIRASYFSKRWGLEANYNSFKGYLIQDSHELSPSTLNGAPLYRVPEMRSVGVGLNAFYFFRPDLYEAPAALDQSEPQTRSGGSWIAILSSRHQNFTAPNGFLPAERRPEYGPERDISSLRMTRIGAGPAYGYLWNARQSFFVSGLLGVSPGVQYLSYRTDSGTHHRWKPDFDAHMKLSLGINHLRGFLKGTLTYDLFNATAGAVTAEHYVVSFLVGAGLRF